jgi:Sec-independent protein secretion pathway component TatC
MRISELLRSDKYPASPLATYRNVILQVMTSRILILFALGILIWFFTPSRIHTYFALAILFYVFLEMSVSQMRLRLAYEAIKELQKMEDHRRQIEGRP